MPPPPLTPTAGPPAKITPWAFGRARPSRRASGEAPRPDSATVPTITRKVTGGIRPASAKPASAIACANTLDTEAATMPRGAMQHRNASPAPVIGEPTVASRTDAGRATSTIAARNRKLAVVQAGQVFEAQLRRQRG